MPKDEKLKELADQLAKDVVSKDLEAPKPKSDIILVLYLSVKGLAPSKVPILARSAGEGLRMSIQDARLVVIPTQLETTRLECINPRLAKPEEQERILELIEKVDREFQEFMNSVEEILKKERSDQEPKDSVS